MTSGRRNAIPSHAEALACALVTVRLEAQDDAAKRLALEYAAQLDGGKVDLSKVGRQYLDVLAALGLTPAARAALTKGGERAAPQPTGADDLARLRAECAAAR